MTVEALVKTFLSWLGMIAAPMITGQVISYLEGDDAWWDQEIPWGVGLPRVWPMPGNMVYDSSTGLMWIADPSAIGGIWGTEGFPETMSWTDAVAACNNLNYGGYSDWRMPNANELATLADYGKDHPALNTDLFKNSGDDDYFSSSTTKYGCQNYFQTDPATGKKSWDQDRDKKKYIRPVRGHLAPWWKGGSWGWK